MSENLFVTEAKQSRKFSGVNAIETETKDGNSCFWVPESERQLEKRYAMENGYYVPEKYGFSELDVRVMEQLTDIDGIDWDISITPINIPTIDPTIDPIDPIDPDDIDISIDIDPDIGLPVVTIDDDIVPDGVDIVIPDIDDITGIDDIDIDGIDDITIDDIDPDIIASPDPTGITEPEIPVVSIPELDIELSIDPETGLPELTIGDDEVELPDIEDMLDLEEDIDISLSPIDDMEDLSLDNIELDISGVDVDGLDLNVSIDLGTLELEEEYLPTSIKIVTPPNKLEYIDGEPINLTGMVVSAYYHDGEDVWANEKYRNGIIPLGELIVDPEVAKASDDVYKLLPSGNKMFTEARLKTDRYTTYEESDGYVYSSHHDYVTNTVIGNVYSVRTRQTGSLTSRYCDFNMYVGLVSSNPDELITKKWTWDAVSSNPESDYNWHYEEEYITHYSRNSYVEDSDGNRLYFGSADCTINNSVITSFSTIKHTAEESYPIPMTPEWIEYSLNEADLLDFMHGNYVDATDCEITLSWVRPKDNKVLKTSFTVSVFPRSGPSPHSTTTSGGGDGHWGGTTISGDNGGSHSSGRF